MTDPFDDALPPYAPVGDPEFMPMVQPPETPLGDPPPWTDLTPEQHAAQRSELVSMLTELQSLRLAEEVAAAIVRRHQAEIEELRLRDKLERRVGMSFEEFVPRLRQVMERRPDPDELA